MDQVQVVRHKVLVEGRTQRAVARELGIARVRCWEQRHIIVPTVAAERVTFAETSESLECPTRLTYPHAGGDHLTSSRRQTHS